MRRDGRNSPESRSAIGERIPLHRRYLPIPKPRTLPARLYEGEPTTCRRDWRRFLTLLAHLAVMFIVFKVYRIEGRAFQHLVALTICTLPVHYLLPYRWKKPAFVAVSIGGLAMVFGAGATASVLAVSAMLIGVARLPAAWSIRAGIMIAIACLLATIRAGFAPVHVPEILWPILGSMFMFRMILYLYEIKHAKSPESLTDALCYFFLLPNYCFIHFPVVDYRALQRGWFSEDVHLIQQTGLRMMFRGTIQLLAYRLVYHELLKSPEEVSGPADLVIYLVCNYLLYLRVSGQFHMACGMIHLFGFRLPETHHRYLLATSFTDYWRRINIYWKDFMVRVVFNPIAFRLKHRSEAAALGFATLAVFLVTWLLHAYQSFWLRGEWGFSVTDALFWGILGGLVLINVRIDASSRRRKPAKRFGLASAACALGTFAVISLLWSLWSSPSLEAWIGLLRRGLAWS